MNRQPYPLSRTEKLYNQVLQSEESTESLRNSLVKLVSDLKEDVNLSSIVEELEFVIKYKREYKGRISFEEWCEIKGYVAGFGRYSKDDKSYPATEIKNMFYSNKKYNK